MRKIAFCLGLIAIICLITTNAYAYYSHTDWLKSPEVKIATHNKGTVKTLASAKAPVTGAETNVDFKSLGFLREGVAKPDKNKQRIMTVTLYEDDQDPNDDDAVRVYTAGFSGYQLQKFTGGGFATSGASGNIDSATDKEAELYIDVYVTSISGDKYTTNGVMFDYDMQVS